MYRIAIVEDEPVSIEKLKRYLQRFSEENHIPLSVKVFHDGLSFISDYTADHDVVFMDIEMPHMNGLESARKMRMIDSEVCLIFVTNLAQYAIEGYAVRAMDFLVKPVEFQNFSMKLKRALDSRSRSQKKELVLSAGSEMRRVRLEDIYFIEVMDHQLIYHTEQGDFTERRSIKEREMQLTEHDFVRCSNSYLVNLRHVTAMRGNDITVAGHTVPVGRTKKKDFMKRLTEYLGDSFQ